MNNLTLLKIRQLDKKLNIFSNFEVPKVGWINFIRKTLGITFEQISNKLNTSAQVIKKFEQNEIEGTITLNTLKKVASAMDCKLVYAFVPDGSFEKNINTRIDRIANSLVSRISGSMSLESQLPNQDEILRQKEDINNHLKHNIKLIWKYEV